MATAINSYEDNIQSVNGFDDDPSAYIAPRIIPTLAGGSKKETLFFKVTLASQTTGEDILLAKIPAGSTILRGSLVATATLANSAQVSIGLMGADDSGYIDSANSVADDVAALKAAAVQSTTHVGFALTTALKYGYVTQKDLYLTLTTSVGTVATEVVYGELDILRPV